MCIRLMKQPSEIHYPYYLDLSLHGSLHPSMAFPVSHVLGHREGAGKGSGQIVCARLAAVKAAAYA